MSVQADLLAEIEAYLASRTGMAETTFGRLAVNDGKFVGRLREGCNMTLATIDRTRKFIKAHPRSAVGPVKPKLAPKPRKRAAKRRRPASAARSTAPKTPLAAAEP